MADDDTLYALTNPQCKMLDRMLRWFESFRKETAPVPRGYKAPRDKFVAFATADIDAATGDISDDGVGLTPGIGDVQPCYWTGDSPDDEDGTWISTGEDTVTCQNLSSQKITGNVPIVVNRVTGLNVCVFESCAGS